MKITQNILAILAECKIENNIVYLPQIQLDRKTYESVNKCLENIGGKWNRKAKGHVFDYDPEESFENLLLTGETEDMKKKFQFFPTPRPVAERMCDMAEIKKESFVLEPSCGKGDLADVIWERKPGKLFCFELNEEMERYLAEKPYESTVGFDFLTAEPCEYWDRIIMNPPFCRQQDIDHVYHAYGLLKSGGILVSVTSPSPFFRTNKKSEDFRNWLDELNAEIVDIDAGEFKNSGTMIATKIIKICKA